MFLIMIKRDLRLITIPNIVNYLQMLMLNLGVLAPIKVEILFIRLSSANKKIATESGR